MLTFAQSNVYFKNASGFSLYKTAADEFNELSIRKYYSSLNIIHNLVNISNNYLPISNFQLGNNIYKSNNPSSFINGWKTLL